MLFCIHFDSLFLRFSFLQCYCSKRMSYIMETDSKWGRLLLGAPGSCLIQVDVLPLEAQQTPRRRPVASSM